jgi:hypothetical protein
MAVPNSGDFHTLIGRAMDDTEFRSRLIDPKRRSEALKEVGIHNPSERQMSALNAALEAIERAADTFGIVKAAM